MSFNRYILPLHPRSERIYSTSWAQKLVEVKVSVPRKIGTQIKPEIKSYTI
jgi:hypothetical protein